MASKKAMGLESWDRIQVVLPFLEEWKMSPAFAGQSVFTQNQGQEVLIRFSDPAEAQKLVTQIAEHGPAKIIDFDGQRYLRAKIQQKALPRILKIQGVEWVEPAPEWYGC